MLSGMDVVLEGAIGSQECHPFVTQGRGVVEAIVTQRRRAVGLQPYGNDKLGANWTLAIMQVTLFVNE